jgi:glycosyltransferase involved in cell wall biosynthesis
VNICVVADHSSVIPPVGGTTNAIIADGLAEALAAAGHEVTVIAARRISPSTPYRVVQAPPGRGPTVLRQLVFAVRVAFVLRRRRSFDVTHLLSPTLAATLVPPAAGAIVATCGDPRLLDPARPRPIDRLLVKAHSWSLRRADMIVAVSDAVRLALLNRPDVEPGRVVTIRNGVRAAAFKAAAWTAGEHTPWRVINVARVARYKNQVQLARVLSRLEPRSRPMVLIAGAIDDPGYRAEIDREAARLGVADRLEFMGDVGRDRLPALLRSCRALVMPSASEGLPMAIQEAMVAGLPVIASDIEPHREAAQFGDITLVEANDADAWARALAALPDSPRRRPKQDPLDWSNVASSYVGAYEAGIERWRSRSAPSA